MIETFASVLPRGAQVLVAGFADPDGSDLDRMLRLGLDARGFDPDEAKVSRAAARLGAPRAWRAELFFARLDRESWDGAWVNNSLTQLAPDACRRAMAILFQALRPGGHLCVIFEEPEGGAESGPGGYRSDDFASLVRQHGFTILGTGRNASAPRQVGLLARRLSPASPAGQPPAPHGNA